MTVDYNNFAKTFSNSRKNMKWEEIEYFLSFLALEKDLTILDIWCWNGRFLSFLKEKEINYKEYLWIDLSEWLLEEAKKIHNIPLSQPFSQWEKGEKIKINFLHLNMLDLENISSSLGGEVPERGWGAIFLIASFHHLDNLKDREKVMKNLYNILEEWGKIFMTNWALNSDLNKEKYEKSIYENSKNNFWSLDYNIKIWKFDRYYHCFDLSELEYLVKKAWFKIIENRLFENKRNFVSVLEK